MKDNDCEDRAQEQLASLKRDMRKTMEDATVRAMHKVMADFEAKSDQRLMENAKGYFERINLVQTGVGIGKPAQQELKNKCAMPEACPEHSHEFYAQFKELRQDPITGGDERRHIICLCPDCTKPAQQQEPVAWAFLNGQYAHIVWGKQRPDDEIHTIPLYASPPTRKPLTHEQRVDLLAKFEAHKHEWHAPAILIDMVEAAHNIKETP